MKYSIAYNFDKSLISYYKKINNEKDYIFEVFFCSKKGYLGGARYYGLPDLSIKETENHLKYLNGKVQVNYLINSSYCPDLNNADNLKKIEKYLAWINDQKPAIVTVANTKILELIRDKYPELPVNISIVTGLKTIKQVNYLRREFSNIKRITLHQTVNRDKDLLSRHIENAKKKNKFLAPVEIELLANEICLYNCPRMKAHYLYNSHRSFEKAKDHRNSFESYCMEKRASDPIHFLNSCFIRPEDTGIYEKLGVDIIKLSGREAPSQYLKLISKAYINKYYSGNIMDLFDPGWWPGNKPPFLDNRDLDGFLKYLWKNKLTALYSTILALKLKKGLAAIVSPFSTKDRDWSNDFFLKSNAHLSKERWAII